MSWLQQTAAGTCLKKSFIRGYVLQQYLLGGPETYVQCVEQFSEKKLW
jgi:hypothetical protein